MYNADVSACKKGHRWRLALGLLATMAAAQVAKSEITFNAAINACESLRAAVKVDKNVTTYSSAISACEKGQPWQI